MSGHASLLTGTALQRKTQEEYLPTGIKRLDRLLCGGIARGHLTEIVGPLSSGRTSLLFSILAQTTNRGELVAYIDPQASLDPASARKSGTDLQRLLWIRRASLSLKKTLKAADILARAGTFGVVVLDLHPRAVSKIPFHSWFRLKRALEGTSTTFLILANQATAGSAATAVISLRPHRVLWQSNTVNSPAHTCLLRGIHSKVELLRGKNPDHGPFYCCF